MAVKRKGSSKTAAEKRSSANSGRKYQKTLYKDGAKNTEGNKSLIARKHATVSKQVDEYVELFENDLGSENVKGAQVTMVNAYYDLVTDFYEYGWGRSFHFANFFKGETLEMSIRRHEFFLAKALDLKPGMKVIDVGCGVGGPMRNIGQFTGATIVGLNNNDYQIQRGMRAGMPPNCSFMKGNFMNIECEPETFDAAYAIEATCHAPSKVDCYKQIAKVLKKGAMFAGYEWVLTDKYDADNEAHERAKLGICRGDGLDDLAYWWEVREALEKAGFEVLSEEDIALTGDEPWYGCLEGRGLTTNFRATAVGRFLTHSMLTVMETLHLAPKGSTKVHTVLTEAAQYLVEGGRDGIFTPMWMFTAVKK